MVPTPSSSGLELAAQHRECLLQLARQVIEYGVANDSCLDLHPQEYDPPLRQIAATFVTLYWRDELKGCIGTLKPHRTLVEDVSDHSFMAAFADRRFSSVTQQDLPELGIEISVLSPLRRVLPGTEDELLELLEPGVDGLLLEDAMHRATFLPKVWRSLPDKRDFLVQLKRKAGLADDYWSDSLQLSLYSTVSFSE